MMENAIPDRKEAVIEEIYTVYARSGVVTTDSRHVPRGSVFVALHGARFNGNHYAAQALADGAAAAVVDDASVAVEGDGRYILVDDTLQALQALAARHRKAFGGPVLQVTGTNGKTTTKELLAAVLARRHRVLYTEGNLNNHIGAPLTLLRLRPGEHDMAIVETGANHPGEIAALARIVQPDFGLVTNVGRAHLEGFGGFEGVKRTKGELYDYLAARAAQRAADAPTGIFVNASDADLADMLTARGIDPQGYRVAAYGHADGDPDARNVRVCGSVAACDPLLTVQWSAPDGRSHEVATHLIGDYNLDNVLAAVAVGLHFGVAPEDIDEALEAYRPTLGRSELRRTARNTLIVDAYNANLTSMVAALANFRHTAHAHKMLILGDMKEMGAASEDAHRRVLDEALTTGAGEIWLVGEELAKAAREKTPEGVRTFKDVDAVRQTLQEELPAGRLILIKGSNSTGLHQLPELL